MLNGELSVNYILQVLNIILVLIIEFFLFGVRLIELTIIVVYKVRMPNKDSLQMFSKIMI